MTRNGHPRPGQRGPAYRTGLRWLHTPLAAMLLSLLLISCGDDKDAVVDATTAGRLDGRTFVSQSIEGRSLVPDTEIRVSFEGGQIGARAGCNSLSAAYSVRDGRLLTEGDGMTTTDMGCDPPRHAQDDCLSDFLLRAPRIELVGDTLTLATAEATRRPRCRWRAL